MTLPEVMVALSILTMVLAGVISSHLFGIRMIEITKTKLGASDEGRRTATKLMSEIRSAKLVKVGEGTASSFTEAMDGALQQGSALQVYASTNTNYFVRYYLDAAEKKLKRVESSGTASTVVANSITNSLIFSSEDFAGNVLTNHQNNRVIGVLLQFYQIQYPVVPVGPGNYYDYYQLRTRVTRRTLE